jgi:hypothetical protein
LDLNHTANDLAADFAALGSSQAAMSNLRSLKMSTNAKLGGAIPAALARLPKLETLCVADCALGGRIPPLRFSQFASAGTCGIGGRETHYCTPLAPGAANCTAAGHEGYSPIETNGTCTPTPAPALA